MSSPAHRQRGKTETGAVLVVSLLFLVLMMLIGLTGMQVTSLEEKMSGNMRDRNLAFQAAESALRAAEASLNPPAVPPTFSAAGAGGFYSNTLESPNPITTASAILTDSFWTANPVATSTVTTLGNGIATPAYIIEDMGLTDCPGSGLGSLGCKRYRITARATGGTTDAVVMVQSIIIKIKP